MFKVNVKKMMEQQQQQGREGGPAQVWGFEHASIFCHIGYQGI